MSTVNCQLSIRAQPCEFRFIGLPRQAKEHIRKNEVTADELFSVPIQFFTRCRDPGPPVGHHGHRRLSDLSDPGCGGSDGGRLPGHRRRPVRGNDSPGLQSLGRPALCVPGGNGCGSCYRPAPHPLRDPRDPCGYPDPAGAVFREPADYGRQSQPARGRGQI